MNRLQPVYLVLGEILRPHGIRGEVRVKILTDFPERFARIKTVYLGNDASQPGAARYTITSARFHKDYLLITFDEITDRNDAELLRGLYVMVELEDAVPLEDDEFYLYELIGMTVCTDTGLELGIIQDVMETGANDVYVLNSLKYGEILVPAHTETIISIDFDAATIIVKLPEGLLPET